MLQVVQHFTELGLNVKTARISSDGGWFVDVFDVTESDGSKVKDARKLTSISRVRRLFLARVQSRMLTSQRMFHQLAVSLQFLSRCSVCIHIGGISSCE